MTPAQKALEELHDVRLLQAMTWTHAGVLNCRTNGDIDRHLKTLHEARNIVGECKGSAYFGKFYRVDNY